MTDPPRFQFSLRTLLMVVTPYAVALGAAKAIGLGLALEFSGLAWSFIFVLLLALSIVPFDRTISRLEGWRLFAVTAILFSVVDPLNFFFAARHRIPQPTPPSNASVSVSGTVVTPCAALNKTGDPPARVGSEINVPPAPMVKLVP